MERVVHDIRKSLAQSDPIKWLLLLFKKRVYLPGRIASEVLEATYQFQTC